LTFPIEDSLSARTLTTDEENDTLGATLSIMSAGLPLPKSPSFLLRTSEREMGDAREAEREERGWWTLRFQQVLRQLQREDMLSIGYRDTTVKI
jgi:hypothetical protein